MMGATGWRFTIPYQKNMTKPLFDQEFLDEMEFFQAGGDQQEEMLSPAMGWMLCGPSFRRSVWRGRISTL